MSTNRLMAAGYVLLGLGMLKEAASRVSAPALSSFGGSAGPGGVGDIGSPLPGEDDIARRELLRGSVALDAMGYTKGTLHSVRNIDERFGFIKKAVEKGSLHPAVRSAAVSVLSRKCRWNGGVRWCTTPKDYEAEVAAIYRAVQDAASPLAMRYVRDHAKVDQFPSAEKLVKYVRADDCDGGVIKLASLYQSVGYRCRAIVMQSVRADSWDHILMEVGIPPGQESKWIVLDWSVVRVNRDKSYSFMPPGWEPPGLSEVRRTGRPAGMVVRAKVYEL